MFKNVCVIVALVNFVFAAAQDLKFGSVSKKELSDNNYLPDTTANAVVLLKNRETYFEYDDTDGWVIVNEIHKRIHILSKQGLAHATKHIELYKNKNSKETVKEIQGVTFNLVEGKIEKTKLKKNAIFHKNLHEFYDQKVFTMPNAKVGSIVEYKYVTISPFWKIDDVVFQEEIPVKKVRAIIKTLPYFLFKRVAIGKHNIRPIDTYKDRTLIIRYNQKDSYGNSLSNSQTASMRANENVSYYEAKDIAALKEEPYVDNIDNYRYAISYELESTHFPNASPKRYASTWEGVVKAIYKSKRFGEELAQANYFKDDLNLLLDANRTPDQKIDIIYDFVKQRMSWNGYYGKYVKDNIKRAYKEGVGNVAEINLMLVAMLKHAGLKANPILISTRQNGIPLFPTLEGFNYVIAGVEYNNEIIFLDATEKFGYKNLLPKRALNWEGRLVRENGSFQIVDVYPREISSASVTLSVKINENGDIAGSSRTAYNNYDALILREKYGNLNQSKLVEDLERKFSDMIVSDVKLQNKNDLEKPFLVSYKFEEEDGFDQVGDQYYFSPLLFLKKEENPFKQLKRDFPINFTTPFVSKVLINIQIPEGFEVVSVPDKLSIALPDNLGSFSYNIVNNQGMINVRMSFQINKAQISEVYYAAIQQFYKQRIEKELENVVLKKI